VWWSSTVVPDNQVLERVLWCHRFMIAERVTQPPDVMGVSENALPAQSLTAFFTLGSLVTSATSASRSIQSDRDNTAPIPTSHQIFLAQIYSPSCNRGVQRIEETICHAAPPKDVPAPLSGKSCMSAQVHSSHDVQTGLAPPTNRAQMTSKNHSHRARQVIHKYARRFQGFVGNNASGR
jgi:hypothetical protein